MSRRTRSSSRDSSKKRASPRSSSTRVSCPSTMSGSAGRRAFYTMRIVKKRTLRDLPLEPARRVVDGASRRHPPPGVARSQLRPLAWGAAPRHQAREHPRRRSRRGLRRRIGGSRGSRRAARSRIHGDGSAPPGHDGCRRHRGLHGARDPAAPVGQGRIIAPTSLLSASFSTRSSPVDARSTGPR